MDTYKPSADATREAMRKAHTCPNLDTALGCSICQENAVLALRDLPLISQQPAVSPVLQAKMHEGEKASNPKDIVGSNKLPLHLFPFTAVAEGSVACLEGLLKYGKDNYREIGVRSSIYYDALRRHMDAWMEGEDIDPESGLSHLAKGLACIAILIDAKAAGKMEDDRKVRGGYTDTVTALTPHVARLKAMHADKQPKHYTIKDNG